MLCACAHGPDIKKRIAPAIQAYYKFHGIRLVGADRMGLLDVRQCADVDAAIALFLAPSTSAASCRLPASSSSSCARAPLDRKVLRVFGCRVAVVNQARLGQSRKRRSELNRIDRLCARRDDACLEVGNEYSAVLLLSCNA